MPATFSPAPAVLAQAHPQRLASLTAGSREDAVPASDGGMAPRWGLRSSALRQAPARRTVARPWRPPRDHAPTALTT